MLPKRRRKGVGRGQDLGKVPGTSADRNTGHPQGLRFKMQEPMQSQVCVQTSIPFVSGEEKIQIEESNLRNSDTLGNPGVCVGGDPGTGKRVRTRH
jgi:hypothetical protein